jgi:hypothetical protein
LLLHFQGLTGLFQVRLTPTLVVHEYLVAVSLLKVLPLEVLLRVAVKAGERVTKEDCQLLVA